MTICLATQHVQRAFLPLALLYLKACLVEREGRAADDVRILEFGPRTPVEAGLRRAITIFNEHGRLRVRAADLDACAVLRRWRVVRLPPDFYRHFVALERA